MQNLLTGRKLTCLASHLPRGSATSPPLSSWYLGLLCSFQMARTQKNKATSAHLGLLKAKLAKLRRELISPKGGGGGTGEGEFSRVNLLHLLTYDSPQLASRWPRPEMPGWVSWVFPPWGNPRYSPIWLAFTPRWRLTSSPRSRRCPAALNTRAPRSSCWICPESLRVPRMARVVVGR